MNDFSQKVDREIIFRSINVIMDFIQEGGVDYFYSEKPLLSYKDKRPLIKDLEWEIKTCKKCHLSALRTKPVPGAGNLDAELVVVGEAPGYYEDKQGFPFVGAAGKLLDRMIEAIGLKREEVYICNVLKCRPPENRTPNPEEVKACLPFLLRQIDIISPKIICALGRTPLQSLMKTNHSLKEVRGKLMKFKENIYLIATYHPSFLLQKPEFKAEAWEDLQKVMAFLGIKKP